MENNFRCNNWSDIEFCFWVYTDCSELNIPGVFKIQFGDEVYSIPMQNMIAQSQVSGSRTDCDLYFALNKDVEATDVRLGDVFFSAFLPIFDVESDMLGLAMNSRALEGASITAAEDPEPTPTSETVDEFTE